MGFRNLLNTPFLTYLWAATSVVLKGIHSFGFPRGSFSRPGFTPPILCMIYNFLQTLGTLSYMMILVGKTQFWCEWEKKKNSHDPQSPKSKKRTNHLQLLFS